ncbi:MAG: slipin family protein [Cyanobacteria bacterium P01_H01_bin.74]
MKLMALLAASFGFLPLLLIVGAYLFTWIRILSEYQRGVVFRLGRILPAPIGPGLNFLLLPPIVDKMVVVDLRTVTLDVPSQDIITKDNVSVNVNAVVYYKVIDPVRAVVEIEDYSYATSQMAQTTLRSILGQSSLDELLSNREKINAEIQTILDDQTEPWGIKVSNVEVKNVDLPAMMQRAMAKQAEAERERRSKVINAEGEFQAAQKLVEAASMMESHPMALQMRYLQTCVEIGAEKNTTILFPLPVDIMEAFKKNQNTQQ